MEEMAVHPDVEVVVIGTAGAAGLGPTIAALRAGKAVALANKEVLVMAGQVVTREAERGGGELRPVDSEHSAIWQCLWGEDIAAVEKLILTASGGAFRDVPVRDLDRVTPRDAAPPDVGHGPQDHHRFGDADEQGLRSHRGAMVVQRADGPYRDRHAPREHRTFARRVRGRQRKGAVGRAGYAPADQCALSYPERLASAGVPRLNLARVKTLSFGEVDLGRYPCLRLALEAGAKGGTWATVLAAADEVAVEQFALGAIGFTDIPKVVDSALSAHSGAADPSLEAILEADAWARAFAMDRVRAAQPLVRAR